MSHDYRGCNFSWIVAVASEALLSDMYLDFWASDSPDHIHLSGSIIISIALTMILTKE